MTYKQKFQQLQHLLLGTYSTFYVWKILQNEEYNCLYKTDNGFWSVVLPALQHEWFIGLARIFEDSKYSKSGAVVSVYSLVMEHPVKERVKEVTLLLSENDKVIKNIARIRDHRYAHNNINFLINPKEFEKKFLIKYSEIERIFEFSDKLLSLLHPEDGHGYMLERLREEAERDSIDVMKSLTFFNKMRDEHRQKWVETGIGDPHFPEWSIPNTT